MILTAEKIDNEMSLTKWEVDNIFLGCLFDINEPSDNYIVGEWVKTDTGVGFHPERLQKNKEKIIDMLKELSDDFRKSGGGGMSFLNMCYNRHGRLWTSEHQIVDKLVALGNAIGELSFTFPRAMWRVLPGGVPCIVLDNM